MNQNAAYTESMNRLIDRLARLPGIGRRTAERLAFHILKSESHDALALASAIQDVKANVRHCGNCFNLTENDPCAICAGPTRDGRKILVVEQPKDVLSLESCHAYNGVYHVLLGRLSPLEGVGEADLTLAALVDRVGGLLQEAPDLSVEIILGTNPNLEGDGTALCIAQRLATAFDPSRIILTRLARGLPSGSQIEYANKLILSDAITSRQSMS